MNIRIKMANNMASDPLISFYLQRYQTYIDTALHELSEQQIIERIWEHDFTVWGSSPDEISNRLGWLHSIEDMQSKLPEIETFVEAVHNDGYTSVLLLGMGGSSLAPELFSNTFPNGKISLQVHVLDSTDPGAVLSYSKSLDPLKTLFIVSTKSGGTEETLSFFKFFYNLLVERIGYADTGNHFVAITDPESKLVALAKKHGFRHIFINDPNVGGRFSALTYFGLVPAALSGVDISVLLSRAKKMAAQCSPTVTILENPAAILGVTLGELAKHGRDKATFILSPQISSFGNWVEQLIAESTGKQGKGILPVIGEDPIRPDAYEKDRLFIYIQLENDRGAETARQSVLQRAGHPVLRIQVDDIFDLGGQFFLWELATAIAGWRLQINPFDQPNVELAKIRARDMVKVYQTEKSLPRQHLVLADERAEIYGAISARSPAEAISRLVSSVRPGDYIAIQAYVQPTIVTDIALRKLQSVLTSKTRLATTIGYGPRFLHSTGQLHKGDGGNGIFLQITTHSPTDVPIPDQAGEPASSITFGVLILAQALGDQEALLNQGRRVLRVHIKENVPDTILTLAEELN